MLNYLVYSSKRRGVGLVLWLGAMYYFLGCIFQKMGPEFCPFPVYLYVLFLDLTVSRS